MVSPSGCRYVSFLSVLFLFSCDGNLSPEDRHPAGGGGAGLPVIENVRPAGRETPGCPGGAGKVFTWKDQIYIAQPFGWRKLSRGTDRYFAPSLSPDGKLVVFTGLSTGIHVARVVDGGEVFADEGTNPSWSPDGRFIAYDRTRDDGHVLTAGDVFIVSVGDWRKADLTGTADRIELRPVFSPGGRRISFECDGVTFVADLVEVVP
jgi:hypothetical protein